MMFDDKYLANVSLCTLKNKFFMKKIFTGMLFLMIATFARSQTVELTVVDSSENTPIKGATVFIHSTALKETDKRLHTGIRGSAAFNLLGPGLLDSIVVESYPYERGKITGIYITDDTAIIVRMKLRPVQIEEVRVGIGGRVRLSNNKIVYYPRSSGFNKTRSMVELLPMIPGVSSRNGKYFFRNDGNFIILIDGVGEHRSKEEQLKILENMPVDAVYRVETLDNPSARYGNGVVAVINFMTKQDVAYTSLKASAGKQVWHGGRQTNSPHAYHASGDSKFRLNGNNLHLLAKLGDDQSLQENAIGRSFQNHSTEQRDYMNTRSKNAYYSFILDRKLGNNLSVQMNGSYSFADDRSKGKSDSYPSGMVGMSPRITTNNSEQLKIRRLILTPRFKYAINKEKGTALYTNPTYAFISRFEDNAYEEKPALKPISSSALDAGTEIHFVDLLIENLINSRLLQTEIGYKHNFLRSRQKKGGNFNYREHQKTFFFANAIRVKNAVLNAGIRAEHVDYHAGNTDTSATDNSMFFYPKVSLTYPLSEQGNVVVGYERQILRLRSIALNPQIRYNGYLSGRKGNMGLQPRVTDYYYARLYLRGHAASLSFKQHRNHRITVPISRETPFIEESVGYDYFRQFYITYNKDVEIGGFLATNVGVYYYMNRMKSTGFDFTNTKDNNVALDLSNELTFGKNRFNFDFLYMSLDYSEYGHNKAVPYNSISYGRLFLDDALGLTLAVNDILGLTRESYLISHPYITKGFDYVTNQRRISVGLSYRFPTGKKSRINSYKTGREDEVRM